MTSVLSSVGVLVSWVLLVAVIVLLVREELVRVGSLGGKGKKRVKVLRAENGCIDLLVDGERRSYLDALPQPLTGQDFGLLRGVLDASCLQTFRWTVEPVRPLTRLWRWFAVQHRKGEAVVAADDATTPVFGALIIAKHIRENGVSIDIEGTTYIVVPPKLLEALEKGDLDATV